MSKDNLKIAIVGAGIWGENHAAIYQDHPCAEVVAVCDQNLDKARQLAGKIGVDAVFISHQDLLAHSDCDVLAIVTPDFAHTDIAVAAARAGRSMIIEKPLATTR
ncbi:MAG TPA: gfo/Idh/MocA family oxidoreductase, partial [Clostridiales bacterium]|nr:gfo/Idh/MocA family oxidoreductase [Clostridiales bacterium]